jgi:hypothetical protein
MLDSLMFLYFNLCLSVLLDSLSCPFTSTSFLTISLLLIVNQTVKIYVPVSGTKNVCLDWLIGWCLTPFLAEFQKVCDGFYIWSDHDISLNDSMISKGISLNYQFSPSSSSFTPSFSVGSVVLHIFLAFYVVVFACLCSGYCAQCCQCL